MEERSFETIPVTLDDVGKPDKKQGQCTHARTRARTSAYTLAPTRARAQSRASAHTHACTHE